MKQTYRTDIIVGDKYVDKQTGIQGTATSVCFFQFSCERVMLEAVVEGKIEEYQFDAPRLTHVETQKTASVTRTGGPGRGVTGSDPMRRSAPGSRR